MAKHMKSVERDDTQDPERCFRSRAEKKRQVAQETSDGHKTGVQLSVMWTWTLASVRHGTTQLRGDTASESVRDR